MRPCIWLLGAAAAAGLAAAAAQGGAEPDGQQRCRRAIRARGGCERIRRACAAYGSGRGGYIGAYYCADARWRGGMLAAGAAWLGLLFVWLGVAASEYLSPNIVAATRLLRMPEGLAGVTLLALGNGAPDLSATLSAVRAGSGALAVGQIVGGAAFTASVVAAATTLAVPEYAVSRRSYRRELCFFVAATALVAAAVVLRRLAPPLAACMLALYAAYVATVAGTTYAEQSQSQDLDPDLDLDLGPGPAQPAEPAGAAGSTPSLLRMAPGPPVRRRRTISGGAEHAERDLWNLEPLRSGSPSARAVCGVLEHHRKSLLAAAECSDMVCALCCAEEEEVEDEGTPHLGPDILITPARDEPPAPDLGPGPGPGPGPGRAYLWSRPRKGAAHLRSSSAPGPRAGASAASPLLLVAAEPPAPRCASHSSGSGISNNSHGTCLQAVACELVPTLRHWHAGATAALKAFVALTALPVLLLTLTVPVAAGAAADRTTAAASRAPSGSASPLPPSEQLRPGGASAARRRARAAASYVRSAASLAFLYWGLCSGAGPLPSRHAAAGVLAAALAANRAYRGQELRRRRRWLCAVPCAVGLAAALAWVTVVADEVVSLTQALGAVLGLSEEMLGLTVVGFGNSLGDLVTNLTLARMGYPLMALSACFGGPMLTLLLGVGVAACAIVARGGSPDLAISSPTVVVSALCLVANALLFLVAIPRRGYRMTRSTALSALLVYSAGMAVNVWIEW
ncbi:hypothetical protein H4R18_002500 [Coemansia javaensis]|uniref:Sodium/calcium exchanger membrane region domain-containing protein n=1 Tax=Coemansia javaensis TaxID=2761396 RepID=A0A9W8HI94_9FUNG|nr:hypothetical protein H4R18_002500 [Coemansia javaensis]